MLVGRKLATAHLPVFLSASPKSHKILEYRLSKPSYK